MNTFLKGLLHSFITVGIFSIISWGFSLLFTIHPVWLDLTIGAVITQVYNWIISTRTTVGYVKR